MKKKNLYLVGGILFVVLVVFFLTSAVKGSQSLDKFGEEMTIYKTSTCGCCEVYISYFKSKGSSNVNVITIPDNTRFMEEHKIPSFLESCHTTIVGKYFVEGHVPVEAINKLLTEQPNILGIGMPGMPTGSPGMPGSKIGDFVVYGVNNDGSTFEFMRI